MVRLGFRLRPATPSWGVGVCACLCAHSACPPSLVAGVCGVGVCAWARVSAAPPNSWLGCWGVCVLVCALRLYPATPGSGVRCGCVCLGLGFGCAPQLLAGCWGVCVLGARSASARYAPPVLARVSGPMCACVAARLVPRHSWLGCAVRVCVCVRAPLVPRHFWLWCAVWICALGLWLQLRPATLGWGVGVCVCLCAHSACTMPPVALLCGVGACAGARVSAAPRHLWLGCGGLCVLVCALCLYPATPGWYLRLGCVCLGSGFGCNPPLLAGTVGCVCAFVGAFLVPRHSWLGCAVRLCVLGLGFRLRPATPGWGVGVCVCVCVLAPLVPRHSWLGRAVWVCVLGLGFRVRPATPGWGVGVCVCLCARSACTPPLLAGVCGLGVCAWARVSAAPRHSWLRCWGVSVLAARSACAPPLLAGVCGVGVCVWLGSRLRSATPGWGVAVSVCLRARPAGTPPILAWVCGVGVCAWALVLAAPRHSWLGCWGLFVFVCTLRLCPATPGWGVRCGCVCWGSGFSCARRLLAGVLGPVCVFVRAPLVPRHCWLGCAVWVFVLGHGFRLRPATPGWGVGVYACLCAHSACPLSLWRGCAMLVCVLGLGFWLRPATPGWGVVKPVPTPVDIFGSFWGVYLWAGKPPLAEIILSHSPDLI